MNKILKFLILAFISLNCINCGGGGDDSDDVGACSNLKIINGDICESKRNPVVKLHAYLNGVYKGSCSGTIITRTSVLTAAHCLAGFTSIRVEHRNASETTYEGYYNAYFTGTVGPHDIGILKVSPAFTNAANFKSFPLLFSKDVPVGALLTTYGFGQDETGRDSVYYPKAAYVKLLGYDNTMFVTMANTGSADHGDSGGPLAYGDKIVGVVSGGPEHTGIVRYANIRETSNYNLIMRFASDVARKSSTDSEEDYSDIAIKWTPSE